MFINVNNLVEAANGLDIGAQPATAVADRAVGYPRPGPGRKKGTALQVHESVRNAILVLLATSTYLNLTDLLEPEDVAQVDLAVLQELRQSHSKVTHQALRMKAWDLSRSVAVGVILKSDSDSAANDGNAVCEDGLGASDAPDGMATPGDAGTRQWDPKTDEAEPRHLNRAPGVRGAAAGSSRPNGKKQVPQSMRPRHMVPPRAAQVKRDLILRSLEDPTMVLLCTDTDVCPYCRIRRDAKLLRREVLVECGEGVATGVMYIWRCGECNVVVVIPAGRDRGIIFTSSSTAYSEVL
ncbi:hypothetical protein I4F81_002379 [Pyropia yezoensis]|uniref:Uncharacterized protein n=1 Tax=Pyropia yezoensis TaxID=2788 RepID=A0ACC3BP70_PYRYE|nr:hypothetical protein I4F81_002379 [Neopyropia yezoensis]